MTIKSATKLGLALGAAMGSTALADGHELDIVFINDGHVAPYHVAWLSGFEDAIAAYDEAFPDIAITGRWLSAEGSLEKMIQQTEVTINENPDVMFVNAINVDAFEPLVAQAQEAGITWVAVHSPMESADYSFTLGDVANGRNQGLAMCALSGGEPYQVAIMLGQAGNPSGEARHAGILEGISACDNIEVVAEQPADWDTVKAQTLAENWLTQFPDLDAISGVTDGYMYPSIAIAANSGRSDMQFFGYDGDIPIMQQMEGGQVMADILLSGTREGWNFVQMAYRISQGEELEQVYDFFTPLVLSEANHAKALENGFPEDVTVYHVDQALEVAANGYLEFGPDSVQ
ncbi:sugar ABC transporter substrate-binding protein [Loktanella sp. F6476L]|uniref:sugar ABC transporter substrate-binding protein n=1 Tax=Loktanella sp. F6476L TaxID=2926405 RepID=UPI001FF4CA22|nr:sugar ABC transporter substrate-binding protein [Loktanella sp. F6476L]MCK0122194.1 sugar ABC transporter substrate-binding protein [Loktanella sp. F6476L]